METYVLNVGEDKRRGVSWHAHKQSLVSRVAEVCPYHDWYANCASKTTIQAHELIGSLTPCEDAQKGSENKAFIQVFHPIQSVKSTNKVMLRYSRVSQKSGTSTLASLRPACDKVRLTGK